ncbi:MAG TPA: hypothetical protein VMU68_11535 [Acidimicrobiales bacterium]|nr:hypothetical protein [Acidimicrobiales bacterium]
MSALKNVEGSASQVNQEILARMCRRSAIDHSPLATLGTLPQCIRLTTPIN